ncbi:MAG TPA: hypothetical protein VHJ20_21470 [Polyangia bacterium]|nr:hypothetical protein [Polyangia bacterium]
MKFGFLADPDRTRFAGLRLRRLKAAIADVTVLDGLLAELGVPAEKATSLSSGRAKLAEVERQIDARRAGKGSPWEGAPPPEVLAATLYDAFRTAKEGALAELFSPARDPRVLVAAVKNWLDGAGLTIHDGLPPGTGFDFVAYHKGMLSGARVVGIIMKNAAAEIDPTLERIKAFSKYTTEIHLACSPAVVAEYLVARAEASGRWDGAALTRRLQAAGVGLLVVEGEAVAQALLPKTRPLDRKALEELIAAFGGGR